MTVDNWITLGGFVVVVLVNAFQLGKTMAGINGKLDLINAENEHCTRDRHGIRNAMQTVTNRIEVLGTRVTRLEPRRHRESDEDG